MALTTFQGNYTITHSILNPDAVCIEQGDVMQILLKDHPVTGVKMFDKFDLQTGNLPYEIAWKNATNVAYDAAHDQLVGTIFMPGPLDPEDKPTFIERAFCMSLAGDPSQRANTLNCYVSPSVTGASPDPDDGSWAGDVD